MPLLVLLIQRLVAPSQSLRYAGLRLGRRSGVVMARSFIFNFSSCMRLCLPPLCASTPPPSFPFSCMFFLLSLLRLFLVLSGLGRNIVTLPQISSCNADAVGLAALASCCLAHKRGPEFTTGVNGHKIRSCLSHGVSRRRRPLLLHPFLPLDIDR